MDATKKTCLLCGSSSRRPHLRKGGYRILRCADCGLTHLDAAPDARELEKLYSEDYFANQECAHGYADYFACERHLKLNFRRRLREIERVAAPGSLLDIGCGPGFFLEILPENWNARGIEISHFASEAAKKKNLNVRQGAFDPSLFEADSFDVVTMWDVLEHLADPFAALRGARDILKPGGALFLSTGNVDSLFARLCGRRWHLYNLPEHLFFFSPATLRRMLGEAGFEVKRHARETCYYSLDYLLERLAKMFGCRLDMEKMSGITRKLMVGRIALPVNLFDISTIYAVKRP